MTEKLGGQGAAAWAVKHGRVLTTSACCRRYAPEFAGLSDVQALKSRGCGGLHGGGASAMAKGMGMGARPRRRGACARGYGQWRVSPAKEEGQEVRP